MIHTTLFDQWQIGDQYKPHLMGILNLSPESFYKESFIPTESLLEKVKSDIANGATMLDFGARSTAPWSEPITIEEEYHRMEIALKQTLPHIPKDILVSIDTQYAEIAQLALNLARPFNLHVLINDISSFQSDPKMLDMVVETHTPVCIMATEKLPGDTKSVTEILHALNATIETLATNDYEVNQIILDPGIGKWVGEKTYEYDLEMLHHLEDFRCFHRPILVGLSRKSFIGNVLDEKDPKNRDIGSMSATAIAVYNGAHIIRAHAVTKTLAQTVQMAYALRQKPIVVKKDPFSAELRPSFHTPLAAEYNLRYTGVTTKGSQIMAQKMIYHTISIQNLTAPQSLILKQEMLARGGEVALHRDVITTENEKYTHKFTAVLMGTSLQFKKLIQKLHSQDLECNHIAEVVEEVITQKLTPKVNFR